MSIVKQSSDTINEFFITQSEHLPEVFEVPGYAYVALGVIGLLYLVLGLKLYKFVLALIMMSIAASITYYATQDLLVTGIVGLAVGLIAFLLQYVFVLLVAGIVFGGIVFLGLYAWLDRASIPLLASFVAIGVGIYLAVKLFKFIIIFSTAAIGAACVTGSFWILYQTREFVDMVKFDPAYFEKDELTVGIIFGSLLLIGMLVQVLILAFTSTRRAPEREE